MNTQELKEYIGRVLGNGIRCLLPSYWWKRLFGLVIDKVDEVEGGIQKVEEKIPEMITSSLAEFAKKYPDVESRTFYVQGNQEKNLELLRKIGEEYGTGLIKQLYLAYYVNPDDEAFIIISPQFGVLNSDGYVFYDVATPLSQIKKDVVIKQDGSVELKDAVYTCKIDTKLSENSTYPLANYATTSHLWRRVTMIELSSTSEPRNKEVYERLNRGLNVPLVICADGYAFRQSSYYQVIATDDKGSTVRLWGSLYDASTDKPTHKYIIVDLDSEGITTIVEEGDIQSSSLPYDDTEIRNELNLVSERIDDLNSEKQDVINDLETIRSGAALGATALQEHQDISHLATKTEVEAKYTKPSSGIPKSDLVSEVQESLGKADTAIQNVKTINGESILGEGDIEIKVNVDTSNLATKEELESLTNEMIANEEVHAAAYNDLDSRLKDVGSLISGVAVTKEEFQEGIQAITNEIIDNEKVNATALNDLNKRVNAIAENVSGETATKEELAAEVATINNVILENEEVHAAALTDLNSRIEQIITRLNNAGL